MNLRLKRVIRKEEKNIENVKGNVNQLYKHILIY